MGDSDQDAGPEIPAWQRSAGTAKTDDAAPESPQAKAQTIEQAKKFLRDSEVQKASREDKIEFLKSKGVEEDTALQLLDGGDDQNTPKTGDDNERKTNKNAPAAQDAAPATADTREDRPPIITYPEFLTKPARPPPLVTVNGFLNTLYAFGGLSALVYGTSRYVLSPMVDSLTDARLSLHETADKNLGRLVEKLEGAVSEIPPPTKRRGSLNSSNPAAHAGEEYEDYDDDTEYDDPTEMFHRDIGVQTSFPPSPTTDSTPGRGPLGGVEAPVEAPSAQQSRRLRELVASARSVSEGFTVQSESHADFRAALDAFKDELYRMNLPTHDFSTGNSFYSGLGYGGSNSRSEADDEIKKAKENIRRVKGVLLSARSFPAGTR